MQRRRPPQPAKKAPEKQPDRLESLSFVRPQAVQNTVPSAPVLSHREDDNSNNHVVQQDPVSSNMPGEVVSTRPTAELPSAKEPSQSPLKPAHPPIKPPPPPWSMQSPPVHVNTSERSPKAETSAPLVLDLSSTTLSKSSAFTESPVATPSAHLIGPVVSSPEERQALEGSLGGPPLTNDLLRAKASSPVKKKMSLNDYMSRRKTETPTLERTQSQGQPVVPLRSRADPVKEMSDPAPTQGQ